MGKGQQTISEYWQNKFYALHKKGVLKSYGWTTNRRKTNHETKFLGVFIDNKLSWKPHIRYICTKAAKGIGVILKARKVFDHETLSTLYYTFVYPYLNYCIHVWGRAYDTHLNDLRVLQNKIIRIINGVPPRTNTDYLYSQQSILSVNPLYFYNIGIFMYKYSTSMLPGIFNNFFHKIEDSHSYCTRQSTAKHLYVNFRSTTRGQRSCIYIAVQLSGISYWTTLTLIVLLVHLKDNLKHYS